MEQLVILLEVFLQRSWVSLSLTNFSPFEVHSLAHQTAMAQLFFLANTNPDLPSSLKLLSVCHSSLCANVCTEAGFAGQVMAVN